MTEPPPCSFRVRGPQYLSSKAKIPCDWAGMRLLGCDLWKGGERMEHVAAGPAAGKVAALRARRMRL